MKATEHHAWKNNFVTFGLAMLVSASLVACGEEADEGESALPADGGNYIVLEGTTVQPTQATWFSDTYLTGLTGHADVTATQSFLSAGSPFPGAVEAPAGTSYLSLFNFVNAQAPMGFLNSAEAMEASNGAVTTWPAGDFAMQWRVAYRESFVTTGAGAAGPLNNVTFVALKPAPELEAQIMQWEDQTHIPWVMQYPGLAKVVRYEKIPGAEVNGANFPKYIELFYFPDQAAADGLGPSTPFQEAEADRMATWTDDQLGIPFVLWATLAVQQ